MLRYPRQRLARPSPPVPVARQRLVLRHYMLTDRATCLHLLDEAKTMPVVQARTHRDRAMRPQLSRTPRHQPLATPPPPTLPLSSQKLGPTERVTRTSVTGMGRLQTGKRVSLAVACRTAAHQRLLALFLSVSFRAIDICLDLLHKKSTNSFKKRHGTIWHAIV